MIYDHGPNPNHNSPSPLNPALPHHQNLHSIQSNDSQAINHDQNETKVEKTLRESFDKNEQEQTNQQEQIKQKASTIEKEEEKSLNSQQKVFTTKQNENENQASSNQKGKYGKINNEVQKLNASLVELKDTYEDLASLEKEIKIGQRQKDIEMKQFIVKERLDRERRKTLHVKSRRNHEKKIEQLKSWEKKQQEDKVKLRVEKGLIKIINDKFYRQQSKIEENQRLKKVQKMYQKLGSQNSEKFYLRKIEQDRYERQRQNENKQSVLQKRRQIYKSLNLEQIIEHEQNYYQLVYDLGELKRKKREAEQKQIIEQNMKMKDLYKGEAFTLIENELENQKLKKEEPKKKKNKMKQYQNYVKQKHMPKTHQPNTTRSQIKQSRTSSHKQVRKYRYLNGVSYGEVFESLPVEKSVSERKQIGNSYMAYLKGLPKKKKTPKQGPSFSSEDLAILDRKLNSITKIKKQFNPLYQKSTHKTLEVKLSNQPTLQQVNMVIKQLKNKDEKTSMKEKLVKNQQNNLNDFHNQHQIINSQIINNIGKKLNLLAKL